MRVGCLIPKSLYSVHFEGTSVSGLYENEEFLELFDGVNSGFLRDAQLRHDGIDSLAIVGRTFGEVFIPQLDMLASRYSLKAVS